eukprot:g10215.t1
MSDASDLRLLDLSLLPEQDRKCILGVAASIMARTCYCPHSARGPTLPDWHHEWVRCMSLALKLGDSVYPSLEPLLDNDTADPAPFIESCSTLCSAEGKLDKRLRVVLGLLHTSLLNLPSEGYDARLRAGLREMCSVLGILWQQYVTAERQYAQSMRLKFQDAKKHEYEAKPSSYKWAQVGLLTVGAGVAIGLTAGVAIGLTAGLAAPAVAGGIVALGLGSGVASVATFLTTTGGVALMSTVFGVGGGGLVGIKVNKRCSTLSQFDFVRVQTGGPLPSQTSEPEQEPHSQQHSQEQPQQPHSQPSQQEPQPQPVTGHDTAAAAAAAAGPSGPRVDMARNTASAAFRGVLKVVPGMRGKTEKKNADQEAAGGGAAMITVVCVDGWLSSSAPTVHSTWSFLPASLGDLFALEWETNDLTAWGDALNHFVTDTFNALRPLGWNSV